MKSLFVSSGLALLCAVALASCGGSGGGSMLLSGSITGLTKSGLVLVNGSETVTPLAGDAAFQFPDLIAVNDNFNITIKTQPTGAVCTIANNVNTANIYTVQQTVVTCVTNSWTLGGVVNGLKSTGLLLSNGSDVVSPPPAAGGTGAPVAFTFPVKVADGAAFGVTVLDQPSTGNCQVAAPSVGTMPAGNYTNLVVNCQ
jgi:hypothetical protein